MFRTHFIPSDPPVFMHLSDPKLWFALSAALVHPLDPACSSVVLFLCLLSAHQSICRNPSVLHAFKLGLSPQTHHPSEVHLPAGWCRSCRWVSELPALSLPMLLLASVSTEAVFLGSLGRVGGTVSAHHCAAF